MFNFCLSRLSYGLLLLTVASRLMAAEIQVAVDRNPVGLNESFQIIFTATEEPDGNPDFSPLEDNFEILNQQRSSNASWVNGKSSRTEQWILNVMAKQLGDLLIPPIAFGADSSKPLSLKVSDRAASPQSNDELFMEVAAAPEKVYVQSQVLYTLRIYGRVQIGARPSLSELEVRDALVEQLGEDSNYRTQINGVDYWVAERKYAIFPQQSGLVTIPPQTLTAEVVTRQQRPSFNGFFNRQMSETRRVSSKAVTLNVLPVPDSFKDKAWLSAENLELKQTWSEKSLQAKVGEPLTRTITLVAKGTTVGQLPELSVQPAADGLKTYPDQPSLKEDKQGDGITASREEKIAYIPGKPGEYQLPEIRIDWFNVRSGKMETASLPGVTVKALGASGSPVASAPQAVETPEAAKELPSEVLPASGDDRHFWQGLSAFLAVGWLGSGLWFYRGLARMSPGSAAKEQAVTKTPPMNAEKALKQACFGNDPQAAKQVLLSWGKDRFGADSLASLAGQCSGDLAEQILQLNRALYASQVQAWDGQALWQAFALQRPQPGKPAESADSELEPLFKI